MDQDKCRLLYQAKPQAVHSYELLENLGIPSFISLRDGQWSSRDQQKLPILKKESYVNGPTEWVGCLTCEHHAVSSEQVFSRQERLLGKFGQDRLANSRVLVVGVSGLGYPAALHLVTAGVGFLRISDGETLASSNLHRQTLYSFHDVGSPKADLAKRRLEELHPFTKVEAITHSVNPQNAEHLLQNIDLVIDCTDNFSAKYLINDSCVAAGLPYVQASNYQNQAQLFAYRPKESPCFRSTQPVQPPADCVESCTDSGVLGAATSIVGSWQALEGIRTLLRQMSVAVVNTIHFDLELADNFTLKRRVDEGCPACSGEAHKFDYEDQIVQSSQEYPYDVLSSIKDAVWMDIREMDEPERIGKSIR